MQFARQQAWEEWLDQHYAESPGVWLQIAKKASGIASVTYAEALDVALCYGWIDGQKKTYDESSFLQKFTPRRPRSAWSKINQGKVAALIESGKMQPAGLKEIERAKQDGRWEAAYDPPSRATVPEDLQAELDKHPQAGAFFATLNSQNRFAILMRIHTAKKPETRARRIQQFIEMLEKGEKIYP
ncbi:MAG: YdeI/OmpD-associated family protein [Chloroflexi bacterium]|nr:YdeI/OmpD-associated family protein [Chloroflexota bacterium]